MRRHDYVYTASGDRVGRRMLSAVRYTSAKGPIPSKHQLAKIIGPKGSVKYGYRSVDRCLTAGLLTLDPHDDASSPRGRGAVKLTFKGGRLLDNLDHMKDTHLSHD